VTDRRPIEESKPVGDDGRPGGTTSWRRSITELGTQMDSYYGRPIVKEPVWQPEIPWYFWTGGIAGASSVLHGIARLAGNETLAKRSLLIGAAADVASPLLLVSDLGRPERFLHMMRMFKVTSPMSVGSWILAASGGVITLPAAAAATGSRWRIARAAEPVAAALGLPLATYTGVLLANSVVPVWSEARRELPLVFAAGAGASAGAAATLVTPASHAGPARRLAIGAAVVELAAVEVMKRRLGRLGDPYRSGRPHAFGRAAKLLTGAGAGLLAASRRRPLQLAGAAMIVGGAVCERWSVYSAGFPSAEDPAYTVELQRSRMGGSPHSG
jgi:hypothetical protein